MFASFSLDLIHERLMGAKDLWKGRRMEVDAFGRDEGVEVGDELTFSNIHFFNMMKVYKGYVEDDIEKER